MWATIEHCSQIEHHLLKPSASSAQVIQLQLLSVLNLMGWILTYCSGVCFHWSFGRPCIVRSVSWVGRKIQRRFAVDDGYKAFLDKRTPAADRICIPPTHSKKQFRRSFRFDWIVTSSAKQHTELPIHMTMKTKIASFFLPIFTRIVFYHVMSSYNT